MNWNDIEIIRSNRRTLAIHIKPGGHIVVRAPRLTTNARIREFLLEHEAWVDKHLEKMQKAEDKMIMNPLTDADIEALTRSAKRVLPERVEYFAELLNVDYGRITIRHQVTRWGSCSRSGNLNFNCLLMLTPPQVQDSVVVHELCHRLEMNHSREFYRHVLSVYPEYKKWDRWLKENGDAIIKRMTG